MNNPTPFLTPSGCRALTVRYPAAMALRAAQLPPLMHAGVTYVPYTGNTIRAGDDRGYYLEYRALRETTNAWPA